MIFLGLASVSLCFVFLIETYAWFIRANCAENGAGYVISKSNLILYSSRLFAFIFQASMAYFIESYNNLNGIMLISSVGFFCTVVFHILIFFNLKIRAYSWKILVLQLTFIKRWDATLMTEFLPDVKKYKTSRLALTTAISSAILGLAVSIPYLLAYKNPNYRMTFGSLIQLLNFAGSITMIFLVDPVLYKLMDTNELALNIYDYIFGRIIGFSACLIIIGVLYVVIAAPR